MIDPVSLGLGGLGIITGLFGAGKQARDAKAQMMMRAAEQEAAPWTKQGVQTGPAFAPSGLGSAMQGALSGFQTGQSFQAASNQEDVNKSIIEKNKAIANKLMMEGADVPTKEAFSDEELQAMEQAKKLKSLGLGAATLYGK